jgi:hypothetical protein
MKNRFAVKPVKVVWRSSMIVGNPITRRFQKFGIYDRNWENDYSFYCPNPGGEFLSPINGQKYRVVFDNKDLAIKLANKMNELINDRFKNSVSTVPISFKFFKNGAYDDISSYMTETDIDNVVIF